MSRAALTLTLAFGLTFARPARAADRFFAPDKALHFTAGAVIAAGGYSLATWQHCTVDDRLAIGAGLALTASVAKELWDISGRGDPSMLDLTWDVLGAAVGLVVTWVIERTLSRW